MMIKTLIFPFWEEKVDVFLRWVKFDNQASDAWLLTEESEREETNLKYIPFLYYII